MKKSEKTFTLFFDWVDDLDQLPDHADSWKIVKAICEYHRSGTNPVELVDGPLKTVVSIMFHQIKRGEAVSAQRAQNARDTNEKKKAKKNLRTQSDRNTCAERPQCNATEYYIQDTIYTSPLQGESNAPAHVRENTKPYGEFKNVYLTEDEYADLKERYGDGAEKLVNKLSAKLKAKGYHYDDHYAALLLWAVQDGEKKTETAADNGSFDIGEFFNASLERSYQEG